MSGIDAFGLVLGALAVVGLAAYLFAVMKNPERF